MVVDGSDAEISDDRADAAPTIHARAAQHRVSRIKHTDRADAASTIHARAAHQRVSRIEHTLCRPSLVIGKGGSRASLVRLASGPLGHLE